MKGDFFEMRSIGMGMEIFWTGLHALGSENWKTQLFLFIDVSLIRNGSV